MNGLSLLLEVRTIWDRSRPHRPQGVGHDHGQPLGYFNRFFSKFIETKAVGDSYNDYGPGAVQDHALLLKVYGVWTCPRWS